MRSSIGIKQLYIKKELPKILNKRQEITNKNKSDLFNTAMKSYILNKSNYRNYSAKDHISDILKNRVNFSSLSKSTMEETRIAIKALLLNSGSWNKILPRGIQKLMTLGFIVDYGQNAFIWHDNRYGEFNVKGYIKWLNSNGFKNVAYHTDPQYLSDIFLLKDGTLIFSGDSGYKTIKVSMKDFKQKQIKKTSQFSYFKNYPINTFIEDPISKSDSDEEESIFDKDSNEREFMIKDNTIKKEFISDGDSIEDILKILSQKKPQTKPKNNENENLLNEKVPKGKNNRNKKFSYTNVVNLPSSYHC